jgi:hypothetical protein
LDESDGCVAEGIERAPDVEKLHDILGCGVTKLNIQICSVKSPQGNTPDTP